MILTKPDASRMIGFQFDYMAKRYRLLAIDASGASNDVGSADRSHQLTRRLALLAFQNERFTSDSGRAIARLIIRPMRPLGLTNRRNLSCFNLEGS